MADGNAENSAATSEAGSYVYEYGAARGFFVGAGYGGKLGSGTYMPGYMTGGELNWTIEGGFGGQLAAGGGLQMRGSTQLLGSPWTNPKVSEQFGAVGTYSWDEASGGFTSGRLGAEVYGGQANKRGGWGFQGDFDSVALGITYGNLGLGIYIDPHRLVNAFRSGLPLPGDDFSSPALPLPTRGK